MTEHSAHLQQLTKPLLIKCLFSTGVFKQYNLLGIMFVFYNLGGDGYSVGSSGNVGHAHAQAGEADRCWCFSEYNVTELKLKWGFVVNNMHYRLDYGDRKMKYNKTKKSIFCVQQEYKVSEY